MHIRMLQADDAAAYRAVRRRALADHPEAFGTSVEEFDALTDAAIRRRLAGGQPENGVLGGFVGGELVGIVYVGRSHRQKKRHRGEIAGMYVAPEHRGRGHGRALLDAALDHLRGLGGVEQVGLAVTVGNLPARRLYRTAGFVTWGVEPAYIRVGDTYHDVEWMVLTIAEGG
jgi:ribosomal protein S18 acetylase RimI-like enzyme